LKKELAVLDKKMAKPDFWADANEAKRVSQKAADLRMETEKWDGLDAEIDSAIELAGTEDGAGLEQIYNDLNKKFNELEFFLLFSGKYDRNNVIIAIHAGTGGVEAQDWAEMLFRMYMKFCDKMNFKTRILDEHRGGEAGIKSIVFEVSGNFSYGYLKSEHGVHRLVRISPFDAEQMRHTSFALVEVLPEIGEMEEIKIDPKDLRIDTYLSGGHGGQSVQTTYSAVRVTHLPTGIVVACQNERSQVQNKETAMKILKSKLHALEEEKRETEKQKLRGAYTSAEWGNQIRSYVLQPYRLVKDHRTKYETQDTPGVLDGDLRQFMEEYLKWKRGGKK
jgi:peptide chain release factor 2